MSNGNSTNEKKLEGKIVIDLVFEAMSANYDQGPGNMQPLKKIVMPDGTVHTLISRYALRYSILKTMENEGMTVFGPGDLFSSASQEDGEGTLQLDIKRIPDALSIPEFQLFGFLVATQKEGGIQIQRENPVKITNAISLTPFEGDTLMYTNLSVAKRHAESMKSHLNPSPFNKEEHVSLYTASTVIDIDQIRRFEFYYEKELFKEDKREVKASFDGETNKVIGIITKKEIKVKKLKKKRSKNSQSKKEETKEETAYIYTWEIIDENYLKKLVERFIQAILNLKRTIQGRDTIWPKFAFIRKFDGNYDTLIDKLVLHPEVVEELETISKEDNGKVVTIGKRRMFRKIKIEVPEKVQEIGKEVKLDSLPLEEWGFHYKKGKKEKKENGKEIIRMQGLGGTVIEVEFEGIKGTEEKKEKQ